jgi:hypothetical protein
MMQATFPHLKRQGGGLTSPCACSTASTRSDVLGEYNGAKEARALTRTPARARARHDPRQRTRPMAATEAYAAFTRRWRPRTRADLLKQNLMAAWATENDIGGARLVRPGRRPLHGNTLFVDGGSHINGVQ